MGHVPTLGLSRRSRKRHRRTLISYFMLYKLTNLRHGRARKLCRLEQRPRKLHIVLTSCYQMHLLTHVLMRSASHPRHSVLSFRWLLAARLIASELIVTQKGDTKSLERTRRVIKSRMVLSSQCALLSGVQGTGAILVAFHPGTMRKNPVRVSTLGLALLGDNTGHRHFDSQ